MLQVVIVRVVVSAVVPQVVVLQVVMVLDGHDVRNVTLETRR
jgi:hypothetical protein